jgi:hypothetical protein
MSKEMEELEKIDEQTMSKENTGTRSRVIKQFRPQQANDQWFRTRLRAAQRTYQTKKQKEQH